MTAAVHVVVRADADHQSGVGHVMRAITLGAALQECGARVTLATVTIPAPLVARAQAMGCAHVALPAGDDEQAQALTALHPDLVVLDGYEFAALAVALKSAGVWVGAIDDHGRTGYSGVDLVIDPNPGARAETYESSATHVCAGAPYALVRSDLPTRSGDVAPDDPVLVALGGADPNHCTLALAQALVERGVPVTVAVGPANPDHAAITAWVASSSLATLADAALINAYADARVAIIGAGTMLWECAVLGIPSVALIVADNQAPGAEVARAAGAAVVVDARDGCDVDAVAETCVALVRDADRCSAMRHAGTALVDGDGALRAAAAVMAALQSVDQPAPTARPR